MNKSLVPAKAIEMPEEFKRFFDFPTMIGDEKVEDYYELHAAIANAVKPMDIFEWTWVNDWALADWDIRRDRRIKIDAIKSAEQELIAEDEQRARMIGYRIEAQRARMLAEAEAENPGKRKRRDNKKNPKPEDAKAEQTKTRDPYLLVKVYLLRGDEIERTDRRISEGRKNRDGSLEKVYQRRERLARMPEKASSEIIDAQFSEAAE